MIVEQRIRDYLHSLEPDQGDLLEEISRKAIRDEVPIIKKETGALLKTMVAAKRPRAILEVGTAVGYSALLMAGVMPAECTITTIEKYEPRIPVAKANFKRAGEEARITLLEGDATEILRELEGTYDVIFMDAAKGQYIHFLPDILRLLPPGGLLISDNVLQDGDIIESRFAVTRRNRTIHARMREYLYELKHHPELETVILPVGDGVTLSTKKEESTVTQNK